LAELSDKSISNPLYRRHELMARIRGCEELAIDMGHVGLFLTAVVLQCVPVINTYVLSLRVFDPTVNAMVLITMASER